MKLTPKTLINFKVKTTTYEIWKDYAKSINVSIPGLIKISVAYFIRMNPKKERRNKDDINME